MFRVCKQVHSEVHFTVYLGKGPLVAVLWRRTSRVEEATHTHTRWLLAQAAWHSKCEWPSGQPAVGKAIMVTVEISIIVT